MIVQHKTCQLQSQIQYLVVFYNALGRYLHHKHRGPAGLQDNRHTARNIYICPHADKENKGEYSTTQVINDLSPNNSNYSQSAQYTELLSGFAFLLSVIALAISLKNKK